MKIRKKIEEQTSVLLSVVNDIKAVVEGGLFGKSEIFKSIKLKSRRILLTAAAVVLMHASAFAQSTDTMDKVSNLYQNLKNNQITQVQAVDQLKKILKNLDKEVKEAIKSKDFSEAKMKLNLYSMFAEGLGEKELAKKINKLRAEIQSSFMEHIDLSKKGVYTDRTGSDIYVIGEINASRFRNVSIRRSSRQLNIRAESLHELQREFGNKWNFSKVTMGRNMIMIADTNNKKVSFLFYLGSISTNKDGDITEFIKKLLEEKKKYVPFK